MIEFRHLSESIRLPRGERWTAQPTGSTYRDAPEGELWDIVREIRAGTPWRDAVRRRYEVSNPWLSAIVTSPARDLFFRQHPPKPYAKILDIGAGWGQIALPLARAGHEVVALEPTPERLAFIEAAAAQDRVSDRMYFLQTDFFEVELPALFDVISCIGVLEWIPKFRAGPPRDTQKEFLSRACSLLAPGGRLVIGIENRIGLKYMLGANDDHIGAPNVAVYDEALATEKWQARSGQPLRSFTFTHAELEALLRETGFGRVEFHAAFPDYKLPQLILPLGPEVNEYFAGGGFVPEHDGVNGRALDIQAELQSHYRTFAALEIAPSFAPSFYAIASRE